MAKDPDMKHEDDPSVVAVSPAETQGLTGKFSKPIQRRIVFARRMSGRHEGAMVKPAKLEKAKKAKTS